MMMPAPFSVFLCNVRAQINSAPCRHYANGADHVHGQYGLDRAYAIKACGTNTDMYLFTRSLMANDPLPVLQIRIGTDTLNVNWKYRRRSSGP